MVEHRCMFDVIKNHTKLQGSKGHRNVGVVHNMDSLTVITFTVNEEIALLKFSTRRTLSRATLAGLIALIIRLTFVLL